jgi:NAD-dependent deacetylase
MQITSLESMGGILMTDLEKLQQMAEESSRIVFFGGAGVSTESGIPDFRGVDGLYRQHYKYPPETMLSHEFFEKHTEEFFRFYRDRMLCLDAEPNAAHRKLAELERAGKLTAVVTQNIDGLHQKAGSRNVYELHGSVLRNYCTRCGKSYNAEWIRDSHGIPVCSCGGVVKPDVVLYGEMLNQQTIEGAVENIASADMLIVGGTSLAVYPAAGLVNYYHGHRLVLINKTPTPLDRRADLVISGKIGETLKAIAAH